ncbi:unnamed protein product [Urochloa humidicola]
MILPIHIDPQITHSPRWCDRRGRRTPGGAEQAVGELRSAFPSGHGFPFESASCLRCEVEWKQQRGGAARSGHGACARRPRAALQQWGKSEIWPWSPRPPASSPAHAGDLSGHPAPPRGRTRWRNRPCVPPPLEEAVGRGGASWSDERVVWWWRRSEHRPGTRARRRSRGAAAEAERIRRSRRLGGVTAVA